MLDEKLIREAKEYCEARSLRYGQDGRLLTDTPEFKAWFGDSKVVDENGDPLVVYHGRTGAVEGVTDFQTGPRQGYKGRMQAGAFFSADQKYAASYSSDGSVVHVFLSIQNPFVAQSNPSAFDAKRLAELKDQGFDGLVWSDQEFGEFVEVIAFDPAQIKSVHNRGTFDANDPRILYQSASVARGHAPARRQASTFKEAREAAKEFQGKELVNRDRGISAVVSRNTLDKMLSRSAVSKSETPATHSMAVANLDALFENGIFGWSKSDIRGEPTISAIHRMFARLDKPDGSPSMVMMTVKESYLEKSDNPLYTVETVEFLNEAPRHRSG